MGQPFGLDLTREGLGGAILTWSHPENSRCLSGFTVERSGAPTGEEYLKVAESKVFSFAHVDGAAGEKRWYRVRAEDLWGRTGPYSAPQLL